MQCIMHFLCYAWIECIHTFMLLHHILLDQWYIAFKLSCHVAEVHKHAPFPLLGYVHLFSFYYFLYYINVIHSNVIHSRHHQLSPILSCHPTLFKQCRVLSLSFTDEGSS